jgi:hypothetical protein
VAKCRALQAQLETNSAIDSYARADIMWNSTERSPKQNACERRLGVVTDAAQRGVLHSAGMLAELMAVTNAQSE